ncbi:hypothetical protein GCM10022384_40940 [Streptomyces marokkonensis]|uniref:Uncharacterized protein n=1 Tax=Streptomyces marokkonensis TaxID=324855 RepID=A0ABP7QWM2_9ACTN
MPPRAASRSQRVTLTGNTVRVPNAKRRPSGKGVLNTGADYPPVTGARAPPQVRVRETGGSATRPPTRTRTGATRATRAAPVH